jgi:hypothetical protein
VSSGGKGGKKIARSKRSRLLTADSARGGSNYRRRPRRRLQHAPTPVAQAYQPMAHIPKCSIVRHVFWMRRGALFSQAASIKAFGLPGYTHIYIYIYIWNAAGISRVSAVWDDRAFLHFLWAGAFYHVVVFKPSDLVIIDITCRVIAFIIHTILHSLNHWAHDIVCRIIGLTGMSVSVMPLSYQSSTCS